MNFAEILYSRLFSHLNRHKNCFLIYDSFRFRGDENEKYEAEVSASPDLVNEEYMLELVDSVERMIVYFRCPVSRLQQTAVERAKMFCAKSGESMPGLIKSLEAMVRNESVRFGIHKCNTATYLLKNWLTEDIGAKECLDNLINELSNKYNIDFEKLEAEYNIAPASVDENSLERRLFSLAKKCADYIGYRFDDFPDNGFYEALLYCTTLIIDIGSEHSNEVDIDLLEDRYFVLLADEILSAAGSSVNTIEFINSRIKLYQDCPDKMIYGLFFLSPFWDTPDVRKWKSVSASDLKKLRQAVRHVRKMISKEKIGIE